MIISKGRGYVFVHIPKTAGTSFAEALESRAMNDDILIGDTVKAKRRKGRLKNLPARGRLWKHSTLADIDGVLSAEDLDGMLVFTLVRNPWDRMVSYYHWLRSQRFEHSAVDLAKKLSFHEFLCNQNLQKGVRATPARAYVTDVQGRDRAALYIRLEHFAQDAGPLFEHLGFEIALPHINTSTRKKDYHSYYDARTKAVIADICAEDIERFDYAFEA